MTPEPDGEEGGSDDESDLFPETGSVDLRLTLSKHASSDSSRRNTLKRDWVRVVLVQTWLCPGSDWFSTCWGGEWSSADPGPDLSLRGSRAGPSL